MAIKYCWAATRRESSLKGVMKLLFSGLCGFPWCFTVPVCGGVGCFCVVVCLPVPCFVVRFIALLRLFVALSPVLAQRPWVWRCCALWRCLWCVVVFLVVLSLVARLVRCCGVLCWRVYVVLPCAVFRCCFGRWLVPGVAACFLGVCW